jgi:CheY-like chemotaxis protein
MLSLLITEGSTASNGEEALARLQADGGRSDLILLDLSMPTLRDGSCVRCCAEARRR